MQYLIINKPYGTLSQFTKEVPEHRTLSDLYAFPKNVYAVGRLDKDSEGLLILTDDKALNQRLLDPGQGHKRAYWVQVEGLPTQQALDQLRQGVQIRINKKRHLTLPAQVKVLKNPPPVWERQPPIRFRANIPTSWLELELTEGKNRQVRRMCAKVGFPVLRLIRHRIENLHLQGLPSGAVKELDKATMYNLLNL